MPIAGHDPDGCIYAALGTRAHCLPPFRSGAHPTAYFTTRNLSSVLTPDALTLIRTS